MPRGDRTGPRGKGPRTGRGLGDCEEEKVEKKEEKDYGSPVMNRLRRRNRARGLGVEKQGSSEEQESSDKE